MTLAQLYPPNTPMAEVAPDFRGMDPYLWHDLKTAEQCEAWLASAECKARPIPKWAERAVATARSNYGIKGKLGDDRRKTDS